MSWRHLIGVLQIFDPCPGLYLIVQWKYLIDVLEIYDGVLGDI